MSKPRPGPSLYTRLGGYDIIAAFVDNWLALVALDARLGGSFTAMSADTRRRARQRIVDLIAERAGGPVISCRRSMRGVHAELGISRAGSLELMRHARTTLDGLAVPHDARDDLLALIAGREEDRS